MKISKTMFALVLALTLLNGCTPKDSSADNSGSNSSGGNSVVVDPSNKWPTDEINDYLQSNNNNETVPALPNVTESYVDLIEDDPEFPHPYIEVFIPGPERTREYKDILEAANYSLELFEDEYEEEYEYYYGENATGSIEIEFGWYPEDDFYDAGMVIYITAYAPKNGPSDALLFDFSTKESITTNTTAQVVWTNSGATFTVSTSDVSSNPVGGNKDQGDFLEDPLRVYAKQTMSFDVGAGKAIDEIHISTNPGKDVTGITAATLPNYASVSASGTEVVIVITGEHQTLNFQVTVQVRIDELVIYYK